MSIFSLMLDAYYISLSGRYFFHAMLHGIARLVMILAQITLVVFLTRHKPEKAVQKVNLQPVGFSCER